ncbi:MAG: hypothetical protein ACKVY0_03005 [Prosthecobacter sp.]|uniref:hypothetical protein n=1 Tax=Prosthecobacter sp. TaxID=1965333 RepID=UPI003900D5DF
MKAVTKLGSNKKSTAPKVHTISVEGVKIRIRTPRDRKGLVPMATWQAAVAAVVATRKKPIFVR